MGAGIAHYGDHPGLLMILMILMDRSTGSAHPLLISRRTEIRVTKPVDCSRVNILLPPYIRDNRY